MNQTFTTSDYKPGQCVRVEFYNFETNQITIKPGVFRGWGFDKQTIRVQVGKYLMSVPNSTVSLIK